MKTTFQIGDMTLHRIVEMEMPLRPALEMFPTLSPELLAENRAWLRPAALDAEDWMLLCFQSYVVRTPHHTILLDACIGNHKERPRPAWNQKTDNAYMTQLAAHGLLVEDIDYVMCSHFHADHVGWNTRLDNGAWVPTFPKARYVFGQTELDHWTARNAEATVAPFADSVLPVIAAGRADIVGDTFALGDHVRLMPTYGHTEGHLAIALGRGADRAVFTGDLIHSPLQARYPELSPAFDSDPATSAVTRRAFLERYCDTETLCCTAHFPAPSIARVKRWGEGFKCEMVD
jgi:glyoxylase-like metal-dependent hydrolase (beta-lactamase superfamily II)